METKTTYECPICGCEDITQSKTLFILEGGTKFLCNERYPFSGKHKRDLIQPIENLKKVERVRVDDVLSWFKSRHYRKYSHFKRDLINELTVSQSNPQINVDGSGTLPQGLDKKVSNPDEVGTHMVSKSGRDTFITHHIKKGSIFNMSCGAEQYQRTGNRDWKYVTCPECKKHNSDKSGRDTLKYPKNRGMNIPKFSNRNHNMLSRKYQDK